MKGNKLILIALPAFLLFFFAKNALAAAPTVTSGSATPVSNGIEKLEGNITDFGGSNATARGFQYGLTSSYTNSTTETGSFHREFGFLSKWGSFGSGNGQFITPESTAFNSASGTVYVTDEINHRVQEFDTDGHFIRTWGSPGSADGQFSGPTGIAVDSASGTVYVVSTNDGRIQEFDTNGNFIRKWGGSGSGSGTFSDPIGIAVDPVTHVVYVADTFNSLIQKFDAHGNFLTQWSTGLFNYPFFIGIDSSHDVYATYDGNGVVDKFDSDGNLILEWGSFGSGDGQFFSTSGITVSASDTVYVADNDNDNVQEFDTSGNFIARAGSRGSADGQFNDPEGLSADASGNVYIADASNNHIVKFGPTGFYSLTVAALACATTHHYRAFATNVDGTSYGSDVTFDSVCDPPTVTTGSATDISPTSVTLGGDDRQYRRRERFPGGLRLRPDHQLRHEHLVGGFVRRRRLHADDRCLRAGMQHDLSLPRHGGEFRRNG